MKTTAKFACFLKKNAIIAYHDSFESYIKLQIKNEEAKPESENKERMIERYNEMLKDYIDMKVHWENAIKSGDPNATNITPETVFMLIEELYSLPIYGQKIKEASNSQNKGLNKQALHGQVVHQTKTFKVTDKIISNVSGLFSSIAKIF